MNYVNANGEPISIGSRNSHIPVKKSRADSSPAEFHRGWRVQGHPPGAMEEARTCAESALRIRGAMSDEVRAAAIAEGDRQPPAWNESAWRLATKKKLVRSKPYEIPDAAQQCAALAQKAGWLDVEIVELKKSKGGL